MPVLTQTIRTLSRPECLICGSHGKPRYAGVSDPYGGVMGAWDVKECPQPSCGVVWLDPAPLAEDLHLAYQQYFTHADDPADDGPGGTSLRAALYSHYRAAFALPAALVGLGSAKTHLDNMCLTGFKPGKLLDVGCGNGTFLNRMRQRGWEVHGVDFDPKAIRSAMQKYGLQLKHGDLKSASFSAETFDAITLSHVIEHVPDPLELLVEVRRVLKAGGTTVITTPNPASLGHQLFRSHWFGLDAPRHLYLFPLNALHELARRAGFSNIRTTSSAAHADIFMGASISIQTAPQHTAVYLPRPSLLRTAKAVYYQYREHLGLRQNPDLGEEAVLTCGK
jgi:2-polyprenyl-3-methyl-5-hydroxy-6-metoxy-1,4-benzoquinol methylase